MKFRIDRASPTGDGNPQLRPTFSVVKEGDEWFVEIETIERLMELIDSECDVIVGSGGSGSYNRITIYDDYVE